MKPKLVRNGEEIRMPTNLERIAKLQEQLDAARTDAIAELTGKRKELMAEVSGIDRQISELSGEKPRTGNQPKQRTCSWCGGKGHNMRACPEKAAGKPAQLTQ